MAETTDADPYKGWNEKKIIDEIVYLLDYLKNERKVGACMRKRIIDALTDYRDIMECVI